MGPEISPLAALDASAPDAGRADAVKVSLAAELPFPAWGRFGASVAMSSAVAIVGAPDVADTAAGTVVGAAYVYSKSNGSWSLTNTLVPSTTGNMSGYGSSVAMTPTTAAVGAPGASQGFVFAKGASGWPQINTTSSELAGKLGTSAAVAGAGSSTSTVMFGQPSSGDGTVFSLVGSASTGLNLDATDGASGDELGVAIALTDTSALIGAPAKNSGAGAAYVFLAGNGAAWSQQAELVPSDSVAGEAFGTSVAIAGDVAVVGAPKKGSGAGAVYVFTRTGVTWTPAQEIAAPAGSGGGFGQSVGLVNGTAVVGAGGLSTPGEVYVYAAETLAGKVTWTEVTGITAGDGAMGDDFSASVGINGTTVIAGAPLHEYKGGAAYIYDVTGILGASCTADTDCATSYVCNSNVCSTPCHVCTGGDCVAGADGSACDDDNACTQKDACSAGTCVGSDPIVCKAEDQCHVVGVCDPSSGVCSNPAAANGAACNDDNVCTQSDTCQSGACVGADPVTCKASDACHVVGTCNATAGCSNPVATNGTKCNDGDACTQLDACQSGACVGTDPVTCSASSSCHVAGTCNPASGACSDPDAPNGTTCNGGTCASGACEAPDAGPKVDDAGGPPAHDAGTDAETDAGEPKDASADADAGEPKDASADADAGDPNDASADAADASRDADVDAAPIHSDDAGEPPSTVDASAPSSAPDSGSPASTSSGSGAGSEAPGTSGGCSAAPTPRSDSRVSLAGLLVAIVFAARRRRSSRA